MRAWFNTSRMTDAIFQRLEERRVRIAAMQERLEAMRQDIGDLEREISIVSAEAGAYEDALSLLASGKPKRQVRDGGRRSLGDNWRPVLIGMAERYPEAVSYEDIEEIAARGGVVLKRDNIRSQMMLYRNKGFVEQTAPGSHRITARGAAEIEVVLNDQAPAESAGAQSRAEVEQTRGGATKPTPDDDPFSDLPSPGALDDEIPF